MKRWASALLLGGGGALTVGAIAFGIKKSVDVADSIERAVELPPVPLPLTPAVQATLPTINLRTTGYWPATARAEERQMEGGMKDRFGAPLHSVEDFFAGRAEYATLSGDDALWPPGQKLLIPWPNGQTLTGRVVDTGSHFRKAGKLYRVIGYEPIDVNVYSSSSVVPKLVKAQIVPGDFFAAKKGTKTIQAAGFKGQTVVIGFTSDDREALARALESELGGREPVEMEAAGWAIRNRADSADLSIAALLAPRGEYGPASKSGGYISTRKAATERTRDVAAAVLDGAEDPTGGATDYWVPKQQGRLRAFGNLYRAALRSGDYGRAKQYSRYAKYGSEDDVRVNQAEQGMFPTHTIGMVELLKRGG